MYARSRVDAGLWLACPSNANSGRRRVRQDGHRSAVDLGAGRAPSGARGSRDAPDPLCLQALRRLSSASPRADPPRPVPSSAISSAQRRQPHTWTRARPAAQSRRPCRRRTDATSGRRGAARSPSRRDDQCRASIDLAGRAPRRLCGLNFLPAPPQTGGPATPQRERQSGLLHRVIMFAGRAHASLARVRFPSAQYLLAQRVPTPRTCCPPRFLLGCTCPAAPRPLTHPCPPANTPRRYPPTSAADPPRRSLGYGIRG